MVRNTSQKSRIQDILQGSERPLSVEEILKEAQKHIPTFGIATVYRTVKTMTESGELTVVELPGDNLRYETSGRKHHHHFHCKECDRVFDIHGCPGGIGKLLPPGFKMDSHEILITGKCAQC